MPIKRLEAFLSWNNLPRTPELLAQFEGYLELLIRFNSKMNLIGPMSPTDIIDQLICDSLILAKAADINGRIIDIGSGAGFPGIPLAILANNLCSETAITLVEPRKKRSQFLSIVKARLNLDNLHILAERIEDTQVERFDLVCSKAFQPPTEWLQTASHYVEDGGQTAILHTTSSIDEIGAYVKSCSNYHFITQLCDLSKLGLPVATPPRCVTILKYHL